MEEDYNFFCALGVFLSAQFLFFEVVFMGEIFGLIRENLRFFSICLVIGGAVILAAKLAE